MNDTLSLTSFDKINLAQCAAERAKENWLDNRRFQDEYDTAMLWKSHRVVQTTMPNGRPLGWVGAA